MDTSETGYRTQAGKNLNISHGCFLQVAGFLFETPYQYQFSGSQCNFLWMRRSSASRHWQEHARFKQHALGMLPPDSSSSESQTLQHLMRLATATRAATNTSSPSHCMAELRGNKNTVRMGRMKTNSDTYLTKVSWIFSVWHNSKLSDAAMQASQISLCTRCY